MNTLYGILTSIALIDSTSMIPVGVVALAVLFAGKKPLLGATAYIAGTFIAYLACGVLVTFGLGTLFAELREILADIWRNPKTPDIVLQIVIGVVLLTVGYRLAAAKRKKEKADGLESVTPAKAFVIAVGLTFVGMPGAIPYLGAIDQILKADVSRVDTIAALAFYNVIFVLPLVVFVLIRQMFPKRAGAIFGAIGRIAEVWGKRVITALLIVLGLLMIIDGVGWFWGHPLIPV